MCRIALPVVVCLSLFLFESNAQVPDSVRVENNYDGVLLTDFIEETEKILPFLFFFDHEWLKSATVRQTQTPSSVHQILRETLTPLNLDYVFLYRKYIVIVNATLAEEGDVASYLLSGYLKNGQTGEGVPRSTVFIADMNHTISTDDKGFFSVKIPSGIHHVFFNAVGSVQAYHIIRVNKDITLEVEMFDRVTELEEVEISGNAIHQGNSLELGAHHLTKHDIKIIPPLFGETDIVRSLLSLPGVKSVGEGASGFNVRGGNVDQNLILIDNASLYSSSHLFGLFSVVNSESVSSLSLHKGTIPAHYGGRLSSVLDITLQDGMNQPLSFEGSLGALSSKFKFSTPLLKDKISMSVAARGAYPDWMLRMVPDKEIKNSSAGFYDGSMKIAYRLNKKNFLSFTMHGSRDAFRFGADTTYTWSGKLASVRYSHNFSKKVGGHFSLFYSKSESDVTASESGNGFKLTSSIESKGGMFSLDWDLSGTHQIVAGVETNLVGINRGNLDPVGAESVLHPTRIPPERGLETSIYFSDAVTVNPSLSIYLGIRFSTFLFLGPSVSHVYEKGMPLNESTYFGDKVLKSGQIGKSYGNIEPRIAIKLLLNAESFIKAGYNRNFQYLSLLSNTTSVSPVDTWKLSDEHLRPQAGDQFSIGYFHDFSHNVFETSLEVYYRSFSSVTQYKEGARLVLNNHIEQDLLQGKGRAYGAEFYLKKNRGKVTGWLSYTYSRSLVQVEGSFEEETISDGAFFPSNFDKPHDLNILANYSFSKKTSISGNFIYNTGRPITYPESMYVMDGYAVANYGALNGARIPDYHRLDLSVSHTMLPKRIRKFETSWSLGVYNAYARKNPFSVFFKPQHAGKYPQAYRLSVLGTIIPYFSFNFKIK
jgi:hypothetical protein